MRQEFVVAGARLTQRTVAAAAHRARLSPSPPPNTLTICVFRDSRGLPYPTSYPLTDAEAVIRGLVRAGVLYADYCVVLLDARTNETITDERALISVTSHSPSQPRTRKDRR